MDRNQPAVWNLPSGGFHRMGAMTPPTSEPPMPSSVVIQKPRPIAPGYNHRARTPTMNPPMILPMMPMMPMMMVPLVAREQMLARTARKHRTRGTDSSAMDTVAGTSRSRALAYGAIAALLMVTATPGQAATACGAERSAPHTR